MNLWCPVFLCLLFSFPIALGSSTPRVILFGDVDAAVNIKSRTAFDVTNRLAFSTNRLLAAGGFSESIAIGDQQQSAQGLTDLWFAEFDPTSMKLRQLLTFGAGGADRFTDVATIGSVSVATGFISDSIVMFRPPTADGSPAPLPPEGLATSASPNDATLPPDSARIKATPIIAFFSHFESAAGSTDPSLQWAGVWQPESGLGQFTSVSVLAAPASYLDPSLAASRDIISSEGYGRVIAVGTSWGGGLKLSTATGPDLTGHTKDSAVMFTQVIYLIPTVSIVQTQVFGGADGTVVEASRIYAATSDVVFVVGTISGEGAKIDQFPAPAAAKDSPLAFVAIMDGVGALSQVVFERPNGGRATLHGITSTNRGSRVVVVGSVAYGETAFGPHYVKVNEMEAAHLVLVFDGTDGGAGAKAADGYELTSAKAFGSAKGHYELYSATAGGDGGVVAGGQCGGANTYAALSAPDVRAVEGAKLGVGVADSQLQQQCAVKFDASSVPFDIASFGATGTGEEGGFLDIVGIGRTPVNDMMTEGGEETYAALAQSNATGVQYGPSVTGGGGWTLVRISAGKAVSPSEAAAAPHEPVDIGDLHPPTPIPTPVPPVGDDVPSKWLHPATPEETAPLHPQPPPSPPPVAIPSAPNGAAVVAPAPNASTNGTGGTADDGGGSFGFVLLFLGMVLCVAVIAAVVAATFFVVKKRRKGPAAARQRFDPNAYDSLWVSHDVYADPLISW